MSLQCLPFTQSSYYREYLQQKGKITCLHLYQPGTEAVFIQFATTSKSAVPPRERYIQDSRGYFIEGFGAGSMSTDCPSASLHRSLILKNQTNTTFLLKQ